MKMYTKNLFFIATMLIIVLLSSCMTYPDIVIDELRWKTFKGGIDDNFEIKTYDASFDSVYESTLKTLQEISQDKKYQILRFQEDTDKLERIDSEIIEGEGTPLVPNIQFNNKYNGGFIVNYKKFSPLKPNQIIVYIFPQNDTQTLIAIDITAQNKRKISPSSKNVPMTAKELINTIEEKF